MKYRTWRAGGLLLVIAGLAANALPKSAPNVIAAAIADPARPAADRAQDINRHPQAVSEFCALQPSDRVLDLMPGQGYYTRIFSKIVGAGGQVYALQPEEMDKAAPKGLQSLKRFAGTPSYANVRVLVQPIANLTVPPQLDLIFTSMNYHDLHDPFLGSPDMAKFNRALFQALKPGGVFIVLDHAAAAGTGLTKTNDLHRIDPAAAKAELTAAGFEFVGESHVLSNGSDDHSSSIYDVSVRGRTDRFLYKFRRPLT